MAALFAVSPSYLIDDEEADLRFDDFTYAMYNEAKDLPEEKTDAVGNGEIHEGRTEQAAKLTAPANDNQQTTVNCPFRKG